LTNRGLDILENVKPFRNGDYLFPGRKKDTGLSNMALEAVLRSMNVKEIATVHGFRSSFRDWAAEETDHAREIAELCLAHTVGDATERAYRRGDVLEKRRMLLKEWSRYCLI